MTEKDDGIYLDYTPSFACNFTHVVSMDTQVIVSCYSFTPIVRDTESKRREITVDVTKPPMTRFTLDYESAKKLRKNLDRAISHLEDKLRENFGNLGKEADESEP